MTTFGLIMGIFLLISGFGAVCFMVYITANPNIK